MNDHNETAVPQNEATTGQGERAQIVIFQQGGTDDRNLPASLAGSRQYYGRMVGARKLDPTYNERYKPFGNFFLNLLIVIREFLQNAVTYSASRVQILRAVINDATYLIVATDAQGFRDEAEIFEKGLPSHESGNRGNSLQGSGTKFAASYSHRNSPELIVLSRLADGTFGCGAAFPNLERNDWQTNACTSFIDIAKDILGENFMSRYNVFSFVRINGRMDSFKIEHLNTLSFLAPDLVSRLDISVYPKVFRSSPEERQFQDVRQNGHNKRKVFSKEEFLAKLCDDGHGRPLPLQHIPVTADVQHASATYRVTGTIDLHAFPGLPNLQDEDSLAHYRFRHVRPSPEDWTRIGGGTSSWPADGVSDLCERPMCSVYPRISAMARENTAPCFQRFMEQPLQAITRNTQVLEAMGINAVEHSRSAAGQENRPFTIVEVDIVSVDTVSYKKEGLDEYEDPQPCSSMEFGASMGRMADFTVNQRLAEDMVLALAEAAKPLVSEATKQWYRDRFTLDEEGLCPFGSKPSRERAESHDKDYVLYDVLTGHEFDGDLDLGKEYFLVVRQPSTARFYDQLTPVSGRTRLGNTDPSVSGPRFSALSGPALGVLRSCRSDVDNGLRTLLPMFIRQGVTGPVTVFHLKVPGSVAADGTPTFGRLHDDGTETPVTLAEYQQAIEDGDADEMFPSKKLWVGTQGSRDVLVGLVRQVPTPAPTSSTGKKTKPSPLPGLGEAKNAQKFFCWDENEHRAIRRAKGGHVRINGHHPAFVRFTTGSWLNNRSLFKAAIAAYQEVTCTCDAVERAVRISVPNGSEFEALNQTCGEAFDNWEDASYNEAVKALLANPDSLLADLLRKVDELKAASAPPETALATSQAQTP